MGFLRVLNYAVACLMYECTGVLIIYYLITHAIYTLYFWASGVKFPILCMLPFGRVYSYRQMAGQSLVLTVFYVLVGLLATGGQVVLLVLFGLLLAVYELSYARVNVDTKPGLFAICPLYKYYYYLKESLDMVSHKEDN